MRILRLRLANFRGIAEREIAFERSGVTVVEGKNEAGKSSLAEALDVVFDELDSTQKRRVRDIQPVDRDVGTEIEVDLETGPYAFTYFKRFFKQRETVLKVTRPAPETLRGREAHERVRAILSQTIDEHLWRVLRIRQGSVAGQASLADATALTRALDRTAGNSAAPEDEASLFAAVSGEYERYYTPTGLERRRLKEAVAEEAAAAAEVEEREESLAALERDIARSADLERRLAGLKRERWQSEELADRREAEVRGLDDLIGRVRRLQIELSAEQMGETAARKELAERHALQERARETANDRRRIEAEATEREPGLREAREQETRTRAALDEASRTARQADELHRLRRGDFDYNRDKLDLTQLLERRALVEAAKGRTEAGRKLLERTRMRKGMLDGIRAAHLALERAEAKLEAAGSALRVVALDDLEAELGGEELRLARGEAAERPVDDVCIFRLPGRVELTVTPGTSVAGLAAARDEAKAALGGLLEAGGVPDLPKAERADLERRRAEETIQQSEAAIQASLRDLTVETLHDKITRLRAWVERYPQERAAEPPLREDFEQAVDLKREAKHAAEDAAEARDGARKRHETARARADALLERARESESALGHARRDEERAAGALARARSLLPDEAIERELERAEARHRGAERDYAAQKSALDAKNPAGIRELALNARRTAERLAGEMEETREELRHLTGRLEVLGEHGLFDECEEARARLEQVRRRRARTRARADAARLLYETMRDEREAARRSYVGPLRDKIVHLGKLVFGDSFQVEMDEGLRIRSRTLSGTSLPYQSLSVGTREQLALVSRLACAMLVDEADGVPLIFDDTLGHTDPERLEGMGAMLSRAGEYCQIIVLTCTPGRFSHVGDAHVIRL